VSALLQSFHTNINMWTLCTFCWLLAWPVLRPWYDFYRNIVPTFRREMYRRSNETPPLLPLYVFYATTDDEPFPIHVHLFSVSCFYLFRFARKQSKAYWSWKACGMDVRLEGGEWYQYTSLQSPGTLWLGSQSSASRKPPLLVPALSCGNYWKCRVTTELLQKDSCLSQTLLWPLEPSV
jgi:hypothetical protein